MDKSTAQDILKDPRFTMPEGFEFGSFVADDGVQLRYGMIKPEDDCRGHVILLHGFSEFIEKYFETIRDFVGQGYAVYSFDWLGQGGSDRHFNDFPERVYSKGFDKDLVHLRSFILQIVGEAQPKYLVGHSMGGHFALHYMYEYSDTIKAAILSAPMVDFALPMPRFLARIVLRVLHLLRLDHFEALAKSNWLYKAPALADDPRSKDPVRRLVHYAWCDRDPGLRLGNVSFGWVFQALRSVRLLAQRSSLQQIKTPILIGVAEKDQIVCNDAIYKTAARLPLAEVITLPDAEHEILMEREPIRAAFLARAFAFLNAEG